jgi:thymidylate synthase (FAD)
VTVQFDSKITVKLDDQWGDEQKICRMARVSTGFVGSYKQDVGLIRRLLLDRHTVPFEHCGYTFYIDSPMTTTRQILKHRISSISETSGRYRKLEPRFYVAAKGRLVKQVGKTMDYQFREDSRAYRVHVGATKLVNRIAWLAYKAQLKLGVAKEKARDVLSPNYYSPLYITMNLGSVLHFLSLRENWGEEARVVTHPQWEISEVARQMAEHVKEDYPNVWAAFVENGYTR